MTCFYAQHRWKEISTYDVYLPPHPIAVSHRGIHDCVLAPFMYCFCIVKEDERKGLNPLVPTKMAPFELCIALFFKCPYEHRNGPSLFCVSSVEYLDHMLWDKSVLIKNFLSYVQIGFCYLWCILVTSRGRGSVHILFWFYNVYASLLSASPVLIIMLHDYCYFEDRFHVWQVLKHL